jgi:hypothetical protein
MSGTPGVPQDHVTLQAAVPLRSVHAGSWCEQHVSKAISSLPPGGESELVDGVQQRAGEQQEKPRQFLLVPDTWGCRDADLR